MSYIIWTKYFHIYTHNSVISEQKSINNKNSLLYNVNRNFSNILNRVCRKRCYTPAPPFNAGKLQKLFEFIYFYFTDKSTLVISIQTFNSIIKYNNIFNKSNEFPVSRLLSSGQFRTKSSRRVRDISLFCIIISRLCNEIGINRP